MTLLDSTASEIVGLGGGTGGCGPGEGGSVLDSSLMLGSTIDATL